MYVLATRVTSPQETFSSTTVVELAGQAKVMQLLVIGDQWPEVQQWAMVTQSMAALHSGTQRAGGVRERVESGQRRPEPGGTAP